MPFSPTPEANWKGGSNRISRPDIARSIYLVSKASLPVLWHVTIITCSTSPVKFQCLGASETVWKRNFGAKECVCLVDKMQIHGWWLIEHLYFADLYLKPDMMIPACPVSKDSFSGSNVKLRNCGASWSFLMIMIVVTTHWQLQGVVGNHPPTINREAPMNLFFSLRTSQGLEDHLDIYLL